MYEHTNFDERPLVAVWETTQACDLACARCRLVLRRSAIHWSSVPKKQNAS
jgi:MoaA/NifB/PqqE/SkfB family radical SAM enzyme